MSEAKPIEQPDVAQTFTVLDWIGTVIVALVIILLGVLAPISASTFRLMFEDFGGQLPGFTVLVLRPWFGPLLAVVPVTLVVLALGPLRTRGIGLRRLLVVVAFVLGLLACGCWVSGVYLPVFALAGAVGA